VTGTRLVVALAGLAVLLPAIVWGGPVAVEIIVAIALVIGLDEYARMAFPADHRAAFAWQTIASALLFVAVLHGDAVWAGAAGAFTVMGSLAFVALRPGDSLNGAADRVDRHVLGVAWVCGLLLFLPLLRRLDHGVAWIFLVLTIPWAGDTGAYFAGRAFGRRPMAPRVSPKKTWEGFGGGLAASILGVFIVRAAGDLPIGAGEAVALGASLGAAAVLGDLSESLLKRAFEVKDSGWIMPGHGGILDRIDSLLFVAPLLYTFAALS
jgi:phosphatidate cytidylyltransferase